MVAGKAAMMVVQMVATVVMMVGAKADCSAGKKDCWLVG